MSTSVSGVHIQSRIFRIVEKIFMVVYYGAVGLKIMVFICAWFDQTPSRGLRWNAYEIVDECPKRKYENDDPFIVPKILTKYVTFLI